MEFPILSLMLVVPLVAAVACLFLGASAARMVALFATLFDLALGVLLWANYDVGGTQWQFTERAEVFAEANGAEVAESPSEAGGCDVVVTATSSEDPVLRGDWLSEGALVCAIGANDPRARELDAQVIARATVVCCDSIEDARLESGDLIEPIAAGQLDWLEVQ